MAKNGNGGGNALARVLTKRMREAGESAPVLDFGKIKSNHSLLTDAFSAPIPRKDYVVCSSVSLKTGQRVLVAWVGDTAVVIDSIA